MGCYVGFMLHLLCNEKGELVNFVLTRANVDYRNKSVIDTLTDKVSGKLYADKGYSSQSLFGRLWNDGIHIVTALRSNMKQRPMPLYDELWFKQPHNKGCHSETWENISGHHYVCQHSAGLTTATTVALIHICAIG